MNSLKTENLISIVIVNWNGKQWLNKCLTSLSKQSYKNTEIIVVDNGSTDGSVNYIMKNFPKVKIIKNKVNLGFPSANNLGVKESKGKYLLLINQDVWVENDFIQALYDYFQSHKFTVISPIERNYEYKRNHVFNSTIDIVGSPASYQTGYRKDKLFFMSVAYLCKKSDYLETLGFDDNYFAYYEDVDWFWRMSLMGKKFGYVDNVFIYHAGAGGSGKGIKYRMFLWRNQNALQTLLKNYSAISLIFVLPLYFVQNLAEMLIFLLILKPQIAYSYIQGWIFNLQHLKLIIQKRRWVQKHRVVGDFEIIKKMYFGIGKLSLLKDYLNKS